MSYNEYRVRTLSIVIPVYNVEQYIYRCLQSIAAQDIVGLSIECILVDDCSQDRSVEVAQSFINTYEGLIRFRLLLQSVNQGVSAARNRGTMAASGEFLLFVDSDDRLPDGALMMLFAAWDSHPDADMIIGNYLSMKDERPFPVGLQQTTLVDGLTIRRFMLNYRINSTPWNKLMRRSLLIDNDLFFVEGIIFEDTNWTYNLLKVVRKVAVMPDVTYVYEDNNPQSIMNTTCEKASLSVRSIVQIGDTIISGTYSDLFADSMLYLLTFVLKAFDLRREVGIGIVESDLLDSLRNRLVIHTLRHGRLLLAFYLLCLLFPPMCFVLRSGWVRRHYDRIESMIKKIVFLTEKLH